ncbi:MAG TPA: bifunctional diaminohydroxyphosphoribosylaminopyrimidine deaminase/5-amino-6-(5-phosphoribosylamino)uracil reductase RibD [Candidatus Desulfobacillus denitrificans]|jgi:diaminohydroxyphosphoribosylaminopyrimidine deaminase/5-amino-6-(5-phosphoribosylamino)uracil reductase|nr:bifunctional diaminohydroxyphosphoribosylaminopyrimidine deaminase/5-amino-6-(5-phosphoribosylamino)uracil reductase RibD [Candidatus Desulfobacillus denitrificans]HNT62164.1 bifunctional diaminohydroxyphosphoribosylaminopyrimidine deaminase/5-amino-6-(5-phosphoribosylamino)uracil reductase RibD [Candidatus Desulfobacillus denitrificans]
MFSAADHEFMARALRLAERGLFSTTPNPRVGCVLVRDGAVVGEGWHARAGEPHAEAHALAAACAERPNAARGATAYVTLEPCSHHGRTPPCTDALIAAGVARVVAAMRDPNPQVAGRGLQQLRAAGIAVADGLLAHEARELNIGFASRMERGRPWLRLKLAASLDGKTALNNGRSQWITGPEARRDGHFFRARACAILTGAGTVRDDDPRLTVRDVATSRQPLRVVVDSRYETPPTARILEGGNTLVAAASEDAAKSAALRAAGAEVAVLPDPHGKVDLPRLLAVLAERGVNELHVEAGHKLNGSLLREGLVDELLLYFAPTLLGSGREMFPLPELTDLAGRRDLKLVDLRRIGGDIRILARPLPA